jgi:hypothetical protein
LHICRKKYGASFSENNEFIAQIQRALHLDKNAEQSRERYHALKPDLFSPSEFYAYLESACLARASTGGMFSSNKTKESEAVEPLSTSQPQEQSPK